MAALGSCSRGAHRDAELDPEEEGGAEGGAPRDKVGAFHAIEEAGPRDIEEGLDLRGRSRRGAWARVCTRACAWHVHARGRAHARADGPMGGDARMDAHRHEDDRGEDGIGHRPEGARE